MSAQLKQYLEAGKFNPLTLSVSANLKAARYMATRPLTPVEVLFRLGDELFRIDRLETAEDYFVRARKLAPASPLPYEGLGLLASERRQSDTAVQQLHEALQRNSSSYLAHYIYAMEKYQLTAHSENHFSRVDAPLAAEIRSELKKSLSLMPDFGPAHHLLGFFEMVQHEDLADAEQHLQKAIQLEPENQGYLFSLAEVQLAKRDAAAARRTLESLRLPYIDAKLRADAEQMLKEMDRHSASEGGPTQAKDE
jgi:Flp pilus assembly protein TadD